MPKRNPYSGRLVRQYSDEQFIRSVKSRSKPSTAKDVAEDIGCNTRIARERLDKIVEMGMLERTIAGSTKVYFVSSF